jgi:beta-ribofuranosylaminobenzene 5'-phosphate synthase
LIAVPETWRILLPQDRQRSGLSGRDEVSAFAGLPRMDEGDSARMCRLVLMQLLPALVEDDLPRFGAAITRIQAIMGDYFGPVQGGRFTSPRLGAALSVLASAGAAGGGQSSWGPCGFAFVRGTATAEYFADVLRGSAQGEGLDITICRPRNYGATIAGPA